MSISSAYSPTKVSGDGVTADVSFSFKVFSSSDIKLSLIDKTTDEVLSVLTLGVDYTVTINPVAEGGEITFLDPTDHDSTMWIFIESEIAYTQPTSFTIDGKLSEKRVEDALDRLLRLIQQVGRDVGLTVQFPSSFTGSVPTMPLAEAGKVLGWNASDELVNLELDPGTALAKASQAEAEAGTDNTGYMTSLRTKQQVTARLASQAEAEAGAENTKLMTALRVKQAIDAQVVIPDPDFSLEQSGSVTAAASFTISSLAAGARYKLVFHMTQNTSNGYYGLRLNGDSGANYKHATDYAGAAGQSYGGSNSDTKIELMPTAIVAAAGSPVFGELLIAQLNGGYKCSALGQLTFYYGAVNHVKSNFGGLYSGAADLSSLTVLCSAGTMTGNWYLYRLN